jgi:signal recognition particle subunit SRP19
LPKIRAARHLLAHPLPFDITNLQRQTNTIERPLAVAEESVMSHPRIEEVEDSDLEGSDPSEGDIDDFDDADILRQRGPAPSSQSSAATKQHLINPTNIPSSGPRIPQQMKMVNDAKQYADFQCLYPVYFDATRSRAEGRRVTKALAVENPLASEIANACSRLRLQTFFEPGKVHPKDWANPGRVKVKLQLDVGGGRSATGGDIKNKHHLYILIARHLKEHPITEKSQALRTHVPGAPMPDPNKPYPRPAIPRGWKMNTLLPFISPAMTGGGVSENLFKDMMKEMQSGGDPMAALMGAGGGGSPAPEEKKKKDKKGKGKA